MADPRSTGLFASLRGLLQHAAELAGVRLELLATELQQEKLRVLESLAWLGISLLATAIGLTLSALFLVMLVGEEHRLAALGVLGALFLAGAWLAWQVSRAKRVAGGAPFEASLAELRRDRDALTGRSPVRPD